MNHATHREYLAHLLGSLDHESAGSMRPMAGNTPGGPNQGVWERIPPGNVNDKAAEVARRIATI